MAGQNERSQRKLAFLKAKIRADDEWRDLTIMNVSATGFMAKAAVIPEVGETVHVQHRGTAIVGQVVWATRTRFGVHSEGAIDMNSLMADAGLASNKAAVEQGSTPSRWWHWRSRG